MKQPHNDQEPKGRTPDRRNGGCTVARMTPEKDVHDDRHTFGRPETKQGELGQRRKRAADEGP